MNNKFRCKVVVILGMHRSGTSAIAGVINLLGVDLGTPLIEEPFADNIKGYWEHVEINNIHERILRQLGTSWSDIRPLPECWWQSSKIAPLRQEILDILRRNFAGVPIWGFKDPRTCRLLPLWHSVFEELNCQPYFIIIVRNPYEVAASLNRRDGFTLAKSFLLWLEHVLDTEHGTRSFPRAFISYDQLLNDWRATMERVSKTLDLPWPKDISEVAGEMDSFLTPDLRHHHARDAVVENDTNMPPLVNEAWRAMVAATQENVSCLDEFSDIGREFMKASMLFSPWLESTGNLETHAGNLETAIKEKDAHIGNLETHAGNLETAIKGKDIHIGNLETAIKGKDIHIGNLETAIKEKDAHAGNLETAIKEKDAHAGNLETAIKDKDTHVRNLLHLLKGKDQYITGIAWQLREKDQHIGNLESAIRDRETALNNIYNSYGWKTSLIYYRIRDKMLPPHSVRRRVIRKIFKSFKQYL